MWPALGECWPRWRPGAGVERTIDSAVEDHPVVQKNSVSIVWPPHTSAAHGPLTIHSISVGTARDDLVESLITIHASAPTAGQTAEHIVETDLLALTGELTMSRPRVDPADGPSLTAPAGILRVRVSYVPSQPPAVGTNGGPGDHFLYEIDLWPTDQARGLVILKQGPNP